MQTTTFDNLPDAMLADEIGAIDARVKAIQERIKAAKEEFKDRDVETVAGERFTVTRSESDRCTCSWSMTFVPSPFSAQYPAESSAMGVSPQ